MLRASRLVIDLLDKALNNWWRPEQAIPSFMCPAPVGITVFNTAVEYSFELRNEDEELLAIDSLVLIPRCPEGEGGEHCRSTCQG